MAETLTIQTASSTEVIQIAVPGPQGATGANGTNGTNGQGVPVGGTTGQVLRKVSGTNYDTEWAAAASGSGSVTSVALAGTGLSISGSPITTSGTITANVSYGTTAGTATQGNDSRIVNIIKSGTAAGAFSGGAGGTIDLSGGNADSTYGAGGAAGSINLSGGDALDDGEGGHAGLAGGSIDLSGGIGGAGGSITLRGSQDPDEGNATGAAGSINLSGGAADGGAGGSIIATGDTAAGGTLNMSAVGGESGGSITTSGGGSINTSGSGGSINTSDGGGLINTRGTGSIELGVSGTRTTLTGTATENRAISLPDAGGTLALTQQATDYEVTDETKGVIMKSPNGTRWRVTIDDSGSLLRTAIALLLSAFLMCGAKAQVRDLVYGTNNVVIGPTNTNALSFTNRVSLPISSGAATTNSILTADGAGGSSFVASRVQTVTLTNNFAVTNFTDLSVTNGNVPTMTVNLEANSLYVARWSVLLTCGAEGAKLEATAGATNGIPDQSVAGRLGRPGFSYGDTYFLGSGSRRVMSLVGFSGAGFTGSVTNGVFNGIAQFRTGASNTTLFWRFSQNTSSNVATTLLSNSIFSVEKLAP
jgi:hypothetical protein